MRFFRQTTAFLPAFLSGTCLLAMLPGGVAFAAADPVDFHAEPSADIIVTAPHASDRFAALAAVPLLQGAALTEAVRPSLGETLAHMAGVSATSFGPTASRPVLRGEQGARVRILTDGLASVDASSLSADHAPAINPLLAERVEVLRGPEVLLYGTSVVGGVVNVIDRRIPRAVPEEAVHLQGNATYGTAADERSGSVAADVGIGAHVVLHADGSYLETGDLRIGGYALSPEKRAAALQTSLLPPVQQVDAEGAPIDFAANAAVRGRLPNTASRSWSAGAGVAFITDGGNFGLSYGRVDNFYGVPIRYATRPGEEQEAPRIDMVQNRLDARAGLETGGNVLSQVKARFAAVSYRHFELEEDGSIGTAFYNKGLEGRLDLVQARHGGWSGTSGAQFSVSDFDVSGAEAFLPRNTTRENAFFTLQQLELDRLKLVAAVRFTETAVHSLPRAGEAFPQLARRFSNLSASLGAGLEVAEGWHLHLNGARTARAPDAEELFANGPHGGTQSYEIGHPDFATERAWSMEAGLRGKGRGYSLELSAYYSWFSGFIYQAPDGTQRDGLPVYRFAQGAARYRGFEAEGSFDLLQLGATTLSVDALADHVVATIAGVGPAPLIPPLRLLGGASVRSPLADLRLEVERDMAQKHVAPAETSTPGYTLFNATLSLRPWGESRPLSLVLSASNIFNVVARRHTSLLKDFAPLAGRDIRLTVRFNF